MSFLIYFFVLLVSAASALFGLDLVSSPLPKTPNVPIGRSVQVAQQQQKKQLDERTLTPARPASPGQMKGSESEPAQQQQAWMPPADDDHATVAQAPAAPTPTASAPAQQAKVEPSAAAGSPAPAAPVAPKAATNEQAAPAANEAEAKVEPAAPNTATVQPAAQQAPNSCNVQACGARYSSFRAADCTYQPYGGDRRLCTIGTSTGATASAMPLSRTAKPRQAVRQPGDRDELGDVERIVRHQPLPLDRADYSDRAVRSGREMTESERIVRRMTRDSETDIPVQGPDGQIIIVRKTYR